MKNANLYKLGSSAFAGAGIVLVAIGISLVLGSSAVGGSVLMVIALVVLLIGGGIVGHLRMRMQFEALRRDRKYFERRIDRLSDALAVTQQSSVDALIRSVNSIDDSSVVRRLDNLEREVIANDSFARARASSLAVSLSRINSVLTQLETTIGSSLREVVDSIESLESLTAKGDARVFSAFEEVTSAVSKANSDDAKASDEVRRLRSRVSSLIAVVNQLGQKGSQQALPSNLLDRISHDVEFLREELRLRDSNVQELITGYQHSVFDERSQLHGIGQLSDGMNSTNNSILELRNLAESAATGIDAFRSDLSNLIKSQLNVDESVRLLTDQTSVVFDGVRDSIEDLKSKCSSDFRYVSAAVARIERGLGGSPDPRSGTVAENYVYDAVDSDSSDVGPNGSSSSVVSFEEFGEKLASNRGSDVTLFSDRIIESVGLASEEVSAQAQRFFNATQNKLQYERAAIEELPKDVADYLALLKQFKQDPLDCPSVGGWSITVPVIRTLVDKILHAPDHEFFSLDIGSGTSTFWAALAMRERGSGKCYTMEHDSRYAGILRERLQKHQLDQWVEVVEAPLVGWTPRVDYKIGYEFLPQRWYDIGLLPDEQFDLMLVDGPPGESHLYSRLPAIEMLAANLADGASIILDDTLRAEERAIATMWMEMDLPHGRLVAESELLKATVLKFVV